MYFSPCHISTSKCLFLSNSSMVPGICDSLHISWRTGRMWFWPGRCFTEAIKLFTKYSSSWFSFNLWFFSHFSPWQRRNPIVIKNLFAILYVLCSKHSEVWFTFHIHWLYNRVLITTIAIIDKTSYSFGLCCINAEFLSLKKKRKLPSARG